MRDGEQMEPIVSAIDELDRLTDFLNKSLDVAEAKADALRLTPTEIDLDELLRSMIALYEPSMSDRGLQIRFDSSGPLRIVGDKGLIHRMIANLFDNELKHLPSACTVTVQLKEHEGEACLIPRDDGAGFAPEVRSQLLTKRVKAGIPRATVLASPLWTQWCVRMPGLSLCRIMQAAEPRLLSRFPSLSEQARILQ